MRKIEALPAAPDGRAGWPWTEGCPALPERMPDGSEWPRVTVVTPSYNQAVFLEATLRSVLLQGYPNLEFIVVDGGSKDASPQIIERYAEHLDYWVSERDEGQPDAINKGLARATGEILTWLNSDDVLMPGALRRVALLSRQRPEAPAWIGACYRVDVENRILDTIRPRGLDRDSLADWGAAGFFYQPSCFIAAEAWERTGPLDTSLEYGFDVDLWLKLAALGELVATEDVLSAAVFHEMAKSGAGRLGQHADTIALQVRHGYVDAAMRRLDRLITRPRVRHLIWKAAAVHTRSALSRLAVWRRDERPRLEDATAELLAAERNGAGGGTSSAEQG